VLVLGDSVAWVVAGHPAPETPFSVSGAFHARCDIVSDRIVVGDEVNEVAPDCPAWPDTWRASLQQRPDAVVVLLGLRQLFDPEVGGQRLPIGSPAWQAAYHEAVQRALGIIRSEVTAPVFWFDVPCFDWPIGTAGEEHDPERLRIVNATLRESLSSDPLVHVVDYGERVCEGTDVIESLRPDGAHPTIEASHDIWRWLAPAITGAVRG
jgi:hypothetical protein